MSLDLDRPTWKRVAFGDVVRNLNLTVKDPSAEGIDKVVAMEHLDPGELKISRWGSIEDGTTFTRRVKPGQTLFGKRRAYQRKAAFAEFDAITSGDILVFEADPTQLLPEFLPFLVQSDGFYDHALGTSAGSLSPRTNWRDLSDYEFDLPPLDEQQRLADLLWALERYRLATGQRSDAGSSLRSALVRERLADGSKEEVPLRTLIRPGTSITYGIVQAGPEVDDGVPYIRVSDMTDGVLSVSGMKRTSPEIAERFERSRVESGDLVVALRGRTGLTLRVPSELDGANLTQGTARVAVDDAQVDPDYVLTIMNSDWMSRKIDKQAKGSTFTELTLAALRGLPIPRLGRTGEAALLAELTALDGATCASSEDLDSLGEFRRSLLNNVFGGAE